MTARNGAVVQAKQMIDRFIQPSPCWESPLNACAVERELDLPVPTGDTTRHPPDSTSARPDVKIDSSNIMSTPLELMPQRPAERAHNASNQYLRHKDGDSSMVDAF